MVVVFSHVGLIEDGRGRALVVQPIPEFCHVPQSALTHPCVRAGPAINDDPCNNVSSSVAAKIGSDLHRRPEHPLGIIKERWAADNHPTNNIILVVVKTND